MSALLQSPNLFRSLRRVSEQEAIMAIGRLALTASDAASGLEALASVALRLSGLHGVEVSLKDADILEWHDSKEPASRGAATGLIAANAREWGHLRILFEPRLKSLECPLRFARILAQQAALMLNRLEALQRNSVSKGAIRRLEVRLDTRKAASRAVGLLAQAKKLTRERAQLILIKQARETKRSPLALARSIILSAETGHLRPVVSLRRLGVNELTPAASNFSLPK